MTGHPDSLPHSPGVDPRSGGEGGAPSDPGDSIHSNDSYIHHRYQTNINHESINCMESEYGLSVPMAPVATPVQDTTDMPLSLQADDENNSSANTKIKLEPLHSLDRQITLDMDIHMNRMQTRNIHSDQSSMSQDSMNSPPRDHHHSELSNPEEANNCCNESLADDLLSQGMGGYNSLHMLNNAPKTWSQQDMENALDALRNHNMSLTKASAMYGIPSTTLWQRAHRLGIDTPKKEGPSKSWSEGNLHNALQALRSGTISANKASKAYGIPSSTLYKIARREGIRLAAPFNAAPTTWKAGDLEKALYSIRSGQSSVQKASAEFGIPTGTLYGRCKREGIELSRTNPTPWSEDAMGEALESVRVGQMSINQAAIHYNLPYSSLYGRFKRCKFEGEGSGEISAQQIQESHQHNSNNIHHQQNMVHSSVLPHDQEHHQSMYSPYHHPPMHPSIHSSNDTCLPHSNQDCITTS